MTNLKKHPIFLFLNNIQLTSSILISLIYNRYITTFLIARTTVRLSFGIAANLKILSEKIDTFLKEYFKGKEEIWFLNIYKWLGVENFLGNPTHWPTHFFSGLSKTFYMFGQMSSFARVPANIINSTLLTFLIPYYTGYVLYTGVMVLLETDIINLFPTYVPTLMVGWFGKNAYSSLMNNPLFNKHVLEPLGKNFISLGWKKLLSDPKNIPKYFLKFVQRYFIQNIWDQSWNQVDEDLTLFDTYIKELKENDELGWIDKNLELLGQRYSKKVKIDRYLTIASDFFYMFVKVNDLSIWFEFTEIEPEDLIINYKNDFFQKYIDQYKQIVPYNGSATTPLTYEQRVTQSDLNAYERQFDLVFEFFRGKIGVSFGNKIKNLALDVVLPSFKELENTGFMINESNSTVLNSVYHAFDTLSLTEKLDIIGQLKLDKFDSSTLMKLVDKLGVDIRIGFKTTGLLE